MTDERRCGTCRFYRASAMRGLGWCVQPQMREANERTFVDKNEHACEKRLYDLWQPAQHSTRIGGVTLPFSGGRLVALAAAASTATIVTLCLLIFAVSAVVARPSSTSTAAGPTPYPSPRVQTPVPAATKAPTKLKIANTDGLGACIRADASSRASCVKAWPDGTVLDIAGADKTVEGKAWRNVKDGQGNTGWILTDYLLPAE